MKNSKVDYSQKVLEVKDLRQFFKVGSGNKKILVKAVDGVSFDVYKREVFGLVGESGCGKTTTGRTIIRLYNPTDGEVIYNGNVIGAGHEGFAYKARRIKEKAKHEIMLHTPIKHKKYELKEKHMFDLLELKNEQNAYVKQYQLNKDEILKTKEDYKETLNNINQKFKFTHADYIHDFNMAKSEVLSKGILPVLDDRKNYIKFVNARFKDKVKFIQDLKIEKYEQNEQIRLVRESLELELEEIEQKVIRRLERRNVDTKNIDLKTLRKQVQANEMKDKKQQIAVLKENLDNQVAKLKVDYELEIENHKKTMYNQEEINANLAELKLTHKEKMADFKERRTILKNEYKVVITELNEDFKANPEKYAANEEKIAEIIAKRDAEVAEQKENIKKAKLDNSFKESNINKQIRLEKLENAKNEFNQAKEELLNKFANDKDAYKVEYKKLREDYKEKVSEIQKTKPSHVNYLSTMQMIFQDPISSLNPRMIVSDIISEGLVIRGEKDKAKNRQKVYDTLNLVGLTKDHATRYPHEFSGGQRQRIGIARAIIANPDFIIADEPISALDVSIQAQVINLLNDLKEQLGLTILFIAHDLSVVKYFSDRIAVMFMGKIVEMASSEELFKNPLHPYTKSLLSAIPHADPETERNRKRVLYNPMMHNYSENKPSMREIKEGHFIYANDEEFKKYKKDLGL